ncbi:hypothetical protein ACWC3X_42095 [Streptomyces populi]
MNALPNEPYPGGCPVHGATQWYTVVIIVVIAVVMSACAGLSPDWIVAVAALLAATIPSR